MGIRRLSLRGFLQFIRCLRLLPRRISAIPLLIFVLAAAIEVLFHVSRFTVRAPEHNLDEPFYTTCQDPEHVAASQPRENAALVMLVRNDKLEEALRAIESIERHFNRWFHYPIVFLNDENWSEDFKAAMRTAASGETRFDVIPVADWSFPSWIDVDNARKSIRMQGRKNILYAGLESYHHMCRFFSGKFYTTDALRDYRWYWRIEPDVEFFCSITYDPFVEMARRKKVYGFTIALLEGGNTCPSLFREVADWKERHRIPTSELWKAVMDSSLAPWPFRWWISRFRHRDRWGDKWSLCHYWSNFEIADLDFFRSKPYQDLFEHLDKKGGFYFERWGDAAVHSLALQMLVDPSSVHHFADVGYRHDWYFQCPTNAPGGQLLNSTALNKATTDWEPTRTGGIGCRCECDGRALSEHTSYCINKLKQPTQTRTKR